jgi:uncharacterized protein DUF4340
MTDATAVTHWNPKTRNLGILGALTALALILAIVAVVQQARSLSPKFDQRPFFPGLADRLSQLGEITVTSKNGTFHLQLVQGKWVVPERNSFPADVAQVRAAAVGMADLTVLEPKTGRADWLNYVGLGAPDKGGDAVDVKLSDASNQTLGDVLVGHTEGTADELGRVSLYVRRPNENQSWLARASLALKPNVTDWLDRGVLNIARDRVKGATITPATGPTYSLARDSKDQPDFKLLDMPAGRSLSFDGSPDGVAGAITGFTFDDVAKPDQFDFGKSPQSVTHTFDGLDVTVKVAAKGNEHWALVSASGTNAMTQTEAAAINARLSGRAFKLPDDKVQQFLATRETLLKPLDKPASGPSIGSK